MALAFVFSLFFLFIVSRIAVLYAPLGVTLIVQSKDRSDMWSSHVDSVHTEIKELDLSSDQQVHGTPEDIDEPFPCPKCSSQG